MRKTLHVTYVLKTNASQRNFLRKEVDKTNVMFQTIQKEKKRCQTNYKEVEKVKGYAKRYLPTMSYAEIHHMIRCIQQNMKEYTYEAVLDEHYVWRGVSLFPMMMVPYEWMKKPIVHHWEIKRSRLYEKNCQFYLHIEFNQHNHRL